MLHRRAQATGRVGLPAHWIVCSGHRRRRTTQRMVTVAQRRLGARNNLAPKVGRSKSYKPRSVRSTTGCPYTSALRSAGTTRESDGRETESESRDDTRYGSDILQCTEPEPVVQYYAETATGHRQSDRSPVGSLAPRHTADARVDTSRPRLETHCTPPQQPSRVVHTDCARSFILRPDVRDLPARRAVSRATSSDGYLPGRSQPKMFL